MTFYSRKSPRIPNYDYSTENYYFITICTYEKRCIFGNTSELNLFGKIAREQICELSSHYESVKVDKYVVMPNHIHLILVLENGNADKAEQIIAQYKSGVSRQIHKIAPNLQVWQRSFHDHIIRNQKRYEKIWMYIETNPLRWEKDCFYSEI